jgi:hypothetical protein
MVKTRPPIALEYICLTIIVEAEMADIIDFNSRTKTKKDRIYNQCPPLKSHEIPQIYEIKLIESHKE